MSLCQVEPGYAFIFYILYNLFDFGVCVAPYIKQPVRQLR